MANQACNLKGFFFLTVDLFKVVVNAPLVSSVEDLIRCGKNGILWVWLVCLIMTLA